MGMNIPKTLFSYLFPFIGALATPVSADTQAELESNGFVLVWEGYAAIQTCVHNKDTHILEQYLFVCDKYSYEYPYHYGDTALLARIIEYQGHRLMQSYLCLDREEDCIEGSLYRR